MNFENFAKFIEEKLGKKLISETGMNQWWRADDAHFVIGILDGVGQFEAIQSIEQVDKDTFKINFINNTFCRSIEFRSYTEFDFVVYSRVL